MVRNPGFERKKKLYVESNYVHELLCETRDWGSMNRESDPTLTRH